jgi:hypothetical protein
MLYSFLRVIPRRLNFMCRRFGILCSTFIGRLNNLWNGDRVFRNVGTDKTLGNHPNERIQQIAFCLQKSSMSIRPLHHFHVPCLFDRSHLQPSKTDPCRQIITFNLNTSIRQKHCFLRWCLIIPHFYLMLWRSKTGVYFFSLFPQKHKQIYNLSVISNSPKYSCRIKIR